MSRVDNLVEKIKRKQITSNHELALKTTEIFRDLVDQSKWADARQLFKNVRQIGKKLITADRMNFTVGNVVKRIYHVIREECKNLKISVKDTTDILSGVPKDQIRMDSLRSITMRKNNSRVGDIEDSLDKIEEDVEDMDEINSPKKQSSTKGLRYNSSNTSIGSKKMSSINLPLTETLNLKLKNALLQAIGLMIEDIESVHDMITAQANEHIHKEDVILTYGKSQILSGFFEEASKDKFFEVLVCETAPSYSGHQTAKELSSKGISTTLVSDSSVYALMSRVDKVIISTHSIMANGGLVTHSGAYMICLAAQEHSVPVYVVGASYKMTPLYPFDFLTYNELSSPQEIFHLEEHDIKSNIEVIIPAYDYVPPELVSLYITNIGGQTPKYIYRVFTDSMELQAVVEQDQPERYITVGVRVLIINEKDQVFLGRRLDTKDKLYGTPGGHLEYSESFAQCASRELYEELNILIPESNLHYLTTLNVIKKSNDYDQAKLHYLNIFMVTFINIDLAQNIINQDQHKCEEWEWLEWSDIINTDKKRNQLYYSFNYLFEQGYDDLDKIKQLVAIKRE
eukprot:403337443